jgi:hypothetical protein
MSQMEMHDPAALVGVRMTEGSNAVLGAAFELMGRRTRALAEFWENAVTWEPEARLNLQVGYLKRMADDYTEAVSGALTPWSDAALAVDEVTIAPTEPLVAPEPATFAEPDAPKPAKAAKRPEASAASDEGHLGGHDGEELDVRT